MLLAYALMLLFPGALLDSPPRAAYAGKLPFAELSFAATLPKQKTLDAWRNQASDDFKLALVAPQQCVVNEAGPYRKGDALDQGLSWIKNAARTLDACHLVLPAYRLRTSAGDKERLKFVVGVLSELELPIVFAPNGLWDDEIAAKETQKLGIACAFDPLVDRFGAVTDGNVYARIPALGARRRVSEGVLEEILDALFDLEPERAFVTIDSPRSIKEAQNLLRIAQDEA